MSYKKLRTPALDPQFIRLSVLWDRELPVASHSFCYVSYSENSFGEGW